MSHVPAERIRLLADRPVNPDGAYVLYWMVAHRRLDRNFALEQAVGHARALSRPLVILEALRVDYPWASQRHHRFVLDGMREHRQRLAGSRVAYHAYVEPEKGAGKGLLAALARHACVVVTDDYPAFFLPRMQRAAAVEIGCRLEAVDANGLYPMRAAGRTFSAAVHFRRHLQKELARHLVQPPAAHPLVGDPLVEASGLPADVLRRWAAAPDALLEGQPGALGALPVDAAVPPVPFDGGATAAEERLARFLKSGLERYAEARNDPDSDAASRLSPYLHWGHISSQRVLEALAEREGWTPARISSRVSGSRLGWWGMSPEAEAFLDELVTWREIGFNFCCERPDYARYESLPEWASTTLEAHASDPRPWVYGREEFETANTHDELWNAAQRELRREGTIHNYLRMLWGKKILEWTPDPRTALEIMVELNNRWAIDGRDPNSYCGIFWVLGRFDRGWPERDVYGKVRSMSSNSTRRKVSLDGYLARYGAEPQLELT